MPGALACCSAWSRARASLLKLALSRPEDCCTGAGMSLSIIALGRSCAVFCTLMAALMEVPEPMVLDRTDSAGPQRTPRMGAPASGGCSKHKEPARPGAAPVP